MNVTLISQPINDQFTDPSAPPVIETHGLTKTYKGVQALESLDLQVQKNSICRFLDPNGAGKTTAIKLLLGLVKSTGGSPRMFGIDIMDIGRPKMNTSKLLMKLLMAATLLALLFCTACASKNEIQSTDGQALIKQGNAYMTCLKEADLECAYELVSPFSQEALDYAELMAEGVVNLDYVMKTYAPKISEWTFDRAWFSIRDGKTIGSLEGKVQFADGRRGKVSLEFESSDGIWKVRASDLQTGISLGLGK